jgi:competence protein ComEA
MTWKTLTLAGLVSLGLMTIPAFAQDAATTSSNGNIDHNDTNSKTKKAVKKAVGKTEDTASDTKDKVSGTKRVDLNSATKDELAALPGMTAEDAQKVIDNRPYTGKNDLVKKNVVSADEYAKIKDSVVAKKSTATNPATGDATSTKGKHKSKPSAASTAAGPSK